MSQTTWIIWSLFEKQHLQNTSEIRRELSVSLKNGASRVETSLGALQAEFYLTTAGLRQKYGKTVKPYGWGYGF